MVVEGEVYKCTGQLMCNGLDMGYIGSWFEGYLIIQKDNKNRWTCEVFQLYRDTFRYKFGLTNETIKKLPGYFKKFVMQGNLHIPFANCLLKFRNPRTEEDCRTVQSIASLIMEIVSNNSLDFNSSSVFGKRVHSLIDGSDMRKSPNYSFHSRKENKSPYKNYENGFRNQFHNRGHEKNVLLERNNKYPKIQFYKKFQERKSPYTYERHNVQRSDTQKRTHLRTENGDSSLKLKTFSVVDKIETPSFKTPKTSENEAGEICKSPNKDPEREINTSSNCDNDNTVINGHQSDELNFNDRRDESPQRRPLIPRNQCLKRPKSLENDTESERILSTPVKFLKSEFDKENDFTDSNQEFPYIGFDNLGNTCYMNSILQSLFGVESFASDLITTYKNIEVSHWSSLVTSVYNLLLARTSPQKKGLSISELLRNVKVSFDEIRPDFCGNVMQDAHEFLGFFLDYLIEEVDKKMVMHSVENPEDSTQSVPINPVKNNFEFEVARMRQCLKCSKTSESNEICYIMSLTLPSSSDGVCTMQDALQKYFETETCEYSCDLCDCKNVSIEPRILRLPRILVFHLKRYEVASASCYVKTDRPITISKYLDIKSFCKDKVVFPTPFIYPHCCKNKKLSSRRLSFTFDNEESKLNIEDKELDALNDETCNILKLEDHGYNKLSDAEQLQKSNDTQVSIENLKPEDFNEQHTYQLISVVSHMGNETDVGHYVSDVLNIKKNVWTVYNDKNVSTLSEDEVCSRRQTNSYLLFYMNRAVVKLLQESEVK